MRILSILSIHAQHASTRPPPMMPIFGCISAIVDGLSFLWIIGNSCSVRELWQRMHVGSMVFASSQFSITTKLWLGPATVQYTSSGHTIYSMWQSWLLGDIFCRRNMPHWINKSSLTTGQGRHLKACRGLVLFSMYHVLSCYYALLQNTIHSKQRKKQ